MRFLCAVIGIVTAVIFIFVDEKPFKVGLISVTLLFLILALVLQLRHDKQGNGNM